MLIINADDLGWEKTITDCIIKCFVEKRIYSASAMVYMKDSIRSLELSKLYCLPIGLHINFTQHFTDNTISPKLINHQNKIIKYLNKTKLNQIIFNPCLIKSFDYVYWSQWEEFTRIYGTEPMRLDGHHHMHLCMNMLASDIYPKGIIVRRNFSFSSEEKNIINRLYRRIVDNRLISRYKCTDYFYSIKPIDIKRLSKIVSLSKFADVELMVHPGVEEEYKLLLSQKWLDIIQKLSD